MTMKIKHSGKDFDKVTIRDLTKNFVDDGEIGITGYDGRLNIRPAYQREFVYNNKERDEVIQTVRKGFPLNTMYWVQTSEEKFELMDGQQRTISICRYVCGDFAINWKGFPRGFENLTTELKNEILDYELSIYVCEGSDEERIAWFNIINIAGKPLTQQEIRNAIYTGPWLAEAKKYFSKTGCPALKIGSNLMDSKDADRQAVLEKVIKWISKGSIDEYMQKHQHDSDAIELWQYFQEVIDWVKRTFPTENSARIRIMKGLEWGIFFNNHKHDQLNSLELDRRIEELINDFEVQNKKGIFEYLLTGKERSLNLRRFDEKTKIETYNKQNGKCVAKKPLCGNAYFKFEEMEADHRIPWSEGGKTEPDNCQMLCKDCNRAKGTS